MYISQLTVWMDDGLFEQQMQEQNYLNLFMFHPRSFSVLVSIHTSCNLSE